MPDIRDFRGFFKDIGKSSISSHEIFFVARSLSCRVLAENNKNIDAMVTLEFKLDVPTLVIFRRFLHFSNLSFWQSSMVVVYIFRYFPVY